MDLRDAILAEHSKEQAKKIVEWVGADEDRFAELMRLFLTDVYRVTQRAGWPLGDAVKLRPHLIQPYFPQLLKQVERDDVHIAVKRNVVRLLQFVEIPTRYEGRIFDVCYRLLDDPKEPVAVRVFSMTVAARIEKNSPELLDELRLVATKYPDVMTPGFRARLRHVFGV
ncbi:MAG TPA: hypothetical protein VL501_05170 [Pyrinomonadaceae bacterium]|nr:hypothetical protein [Pyrinomonadaceae bacterium]